MSLNIEALRAKLNQFTRQNDRGDALWKPTEGKTEIRIVPWKDNPSNPFIELYFHYLGNKTHLSPTSYGNRDPIAEFADALASGGSKDDYAQARPFRPKLRTYIPIIVRGEESQGVRFYSFGKTVYTDILAIIADPDYGDITDVATGTDLVLEYIPQEKSDTSFAKTMVRAKRNPSPLHPDPAVVQKFLTEQPDLRAIFKEPTYEELKVFLERYLDPESNPVEHVERDDTATTATPAAQPSPSVTATRSAEVTSTSVKDMIDEFDEVFN
jgi:hypothetical protein